jgi:hypothetical protein
MAACRPNLKTAPSVDLFLSRFAESEWREVVRPWLESGAGGLGRSLVVAPTRGQTQALKQRCVDERIALLGVEFLTPGLARRKRGAPDGVSRSLQMLVLRGLVEARIAALEPADPARGLWKSLASDLDAAVSEFDDLVRGEFRAEDFRLAELREVFGAMTRWMDSHGYPLGPLLDGAAARHPADPGAPQVADRLLILAGGAEGWPDFLGLVALARRCPSVTVCLAEPEFSGKGVAGEEWVGLWERVLGVDHQVVDAADPEETCAGVADLWLGGGGSAERSRVIVSRSREEEMARVAGELERLLAGGSDNIAVIFPGPGAAHARLAGLLEERAVPFADLIGRVGTPAVDTRLLRSLADFYERGGRLEELLAIWPLLRSTNLTQLSPGDARRVCQRLFDDVQSHSVELHVGRLEAAEDPDGREVGRIARLLLPGWPAQLTPADALDRFEAAMGRLGLAEPEGWHRLREFAARAAEPMPSRALLEVIRDFLPQRGPAPGAFPANGFARVTLTTCRRAAGVAWSDSIFVQANAGVWPERREPSCWLGDEARRELCAEQGRFPLALPTADDRAALERRLYCSVARDTRRGVLFTAALFSEEEPEVKLGPNVWLERVMWSKGLFAGTGGGPEAFEELARAPNDSGAAALRPRPAGWGAVWLRRRDPAAPFDEYFLGEPSGLHRPPRLSASQIERGVKDPATLWFDAVLGVRRVEWRPFSRARRKSVGIAAHRVLAAALRGAPAEGGFTVLQEHALAKAKLEGLLAGLRGSWPLDRYWDSFHMDVSEAARDLMGQVYALPISGFIAVEAPIPNGAGVCLPGAGAVRVTGRMDAVLSDRPRWEGARVEIVDFKTGGDAKLSASRMASSGASLQLGVYLAAARHAGASGRVWMLKPGERPMSIGMEELDRACSKLVLIGEHLSRGIYGARTADRDEYTPIFEWPLACPPVASAILESKFSATFGPGNAEDGDA